jgi:putative tricarboxylic transport membrane protein
VTTAHPSASPRWASRAVRPKTIFFGLLLVLLAAYTEMGWDLEWRTAAGRIGPGFFPRIIGMLGMALTLVALVQTVLAPPETDEVVPLEDEVGDADLGKHPLIFGATVGAGLLMMVLLTSLGAIIAPALFLFGMLTMLNRGRLVFNVVLSVLLPVALYLLFETFLNAGLPNGVLPRF